MWRHKAWFTSSDRIIYEYRSRREKVCQIESFPFFCVYSCNAKSAKCEMRNSLTIISWNNAELRYWGVTPLWVKTRDKHHQTSSFLLSTHHIFLWKLSLWINVSLCFISLHETGHWKSPQCVRYNCGVTQRQLRGLLGLITHTQRHVERVKQNNVLRMYSATTHICKCWLQSSSALPRPPSLSKAQGGGNTTVPWLLRAYISL